MNFTKEYIELCKNEKIQGLRPHRINDYGEEQWQYKKWDFRFYTFTDEIEILRNDDPDFSWVSTKDWWLPTCEQLDNEIMKICEKQKGIYEFRYYSSADLFKTEISFTKSSNFVEADRHNPLIAKIKLLIKLLEV